MQAEVSFNAPCLCSKRRDQTAISKMNKRRRAAYLLLMLANMSDLAKWVDKVKIGKFPRIN